MEHFVNLLDILEDSNREALNIVVDTSTLDENQLRLVEQGNIKIVQLTDGNQFHLPSELELN